MIRATIHQCKQKVLYAFSALRVDLQGMGKKNKEYLIRYKNRHQGGQCFIIGNGPSLTKEDLEKLTGEVTFASNRIYHMFQDTNWRPTFYAIMDEGVAKREGTITGINSFDCEMKFVRKEGYHAYRKIKRPVCYLHSWWAREYLDAPQFSTDLGEGIYTIATVTYAMIQIARYMGFDKIYLIGMDNTYEYTIRRDGIILKNKGTKSYFAGEKYRPDAASAAPTWEMDLAYEFADSYSRKHGFRIYNVTRGGCLEKFERKDLDEVLSPECHVGNVSAMQEW